MTQIQMGKTKIVMKLRVKLPYRNEVDIMEVKVDKGAEANILPLHTFTSMFPHKLDEDGYPKDGFKGSKMTLQCYDDSKLVNHGMLTLELKHYSKNSFQDHQFFVVETPTRKEIIIGHPVSVRLGLLQVLCKNYAKTVSSVETIHTNNLSQVKHIDGKTWPENRSSSEPRRGRKGRNESFQDLLSRPQSITGQNKHERTKTSSFQDPNFRSQHMHGKNHWKQSKSSSFQDHHPQQQSQKWQNEFLSRPHLASTQKGQNKLISTPSFKTLDTHNSTYGNKSSFQDLFSRPLIQSIANRVKNLNSKYYLPTHEHTKVISDPEKALRDQPWEQSAVAPQQASRFNPIYMEPGSTQINCTKDLQTLYPNSFDRIGDMSGAYDIKIDPQVPPMQHGRHKVLIGYKAEIEKESNKKVH